ncbi:MAG: DUF4440 domain-containing protein [Candidatus Devosia euplotis]|nr:DUF4440 domain-containing protein [Candidatus Devosia euplotis]
MGANKKEGLMRPIPFAAILAVAMTTVLTQAAENTPISDESAVLQTVQTMTDAFARGDIEMVMSTYVDLATAVSEPGQLVTGDAPLRSMFADFVAAGVNFTYGAHEVVVSGETALHLMAWEAPGLTFQGTCPSVAVLKRQGDSTWKMVIDYPFGDGVLVRQ